MQIATLEILEEAQFPPIQVRALAKVFEAIENTWRSDLVTVPVLDARLAELKGELKSEILECRSELKADIHSFRGELKADIHSLRSELKADIHSLRDEFKADIHLLRDEFKSDVHALGGEFKSEIGDLKAGIQAAKSEMSRWILLAIMGQATVYLGMMYFLLTHVR